MSVRRRVILTAAGTVRYLPGAPAGEIARRNGAGQDEAAQSLPPFRGSRAMRRVATLPFLEKRFSASGARPVDLFDRVAVQLDLGRLHDLP